jgi:hypothetical protein
VVDEAVNSIMNAAVADATSYDQQQRRRRVSGGG